MLKYIDVYDEAYHNSGPRTKKISEIVLHGTEGSKEASFAWWKSSSNPTQSSAHDLIATNGDIYHCIPYDIIANHANDHNPYSIGIELECPRDGYINWPIAQIQACVFHVQNLMREFNIDVIKYHKDLNPKKTDPRDWDADYFQKAIRAATEQDLLDYLQDVIPINPEAAFMKFGRARGWEPATKEFYTMGSAGQIWRDKNDNKYILHCPIGYWHKIMVLEVFK